MTKKFFLLVFAIFIYQNNWCQTGYDTINVYFDIGEYVIKEDQKKILDSVIQLATKDNRKMLIYGYADYLGTSKPNQTLSDNRAKVVNDYLLEHKLPKEYIIQYAGVGQINKKKEDEHGNQDFRKVEIFLRKKAPDDIFFDSYLTHSSKSDSLKNSTPDSYQYYRRMLSLEVGQTFVLNNIHFYLARSTMIPESKPFLDELLKIMLENKNLVIKLEGHVCCLDNDGDSYDDDKRNNKLSVNRAEVIYNYLIKNGVEPSRVSFEGFGRKRPIHKIEKTEQQAQENRRVEVRIISK